jgi:hypothetical protein
MSEHRYPFEPLAAAMRLSGHQASKTLGLSGRTQQSYRRDGMSERVADRLAVKAGLHPFEVWPEMVGHQIEAASVVCADESCGGPFVPERSNQRYCSPACRKRASDRRTYRSDPARRAKKRAGRRAYYAENAEYERSRERRRYRARIEAENAA